MTEQTPYYVAFSHIFGIGPEHLKDLLTTCGTPQDAYKAKSKLLAQILPPLQYKNLLTFRAHNSPHSIIQDLLKKDVQILTPDMPEWPQRLRTIPTPPLCLYIRGNASLLYESNLSATPSLAIVGTRQATEYGRTITAKFTAPLAATGITIISGLAAGIDALAHETTLNNGGRTIAILGNGVDIIYPRQNRPLYQRILDEGSVVASEFLPGQHAQKGFFVIRNRIVSGLSDAVLVIEGDEKSGTLSTISHAGDQGRPLFGIPYSLNSSYSYAPNHAVQVGGALAVCPGDIYSWVKSGPAYQPRTPLFDLLPQEHRLFSALYKEQATPDSLSDRLDIAIPDTLTLLTQLEMKGYVEKNALGEYHITS